jgi:hypothetical protein
VRCTLAGLSIEGHDISSTMLAELFQDGQRSMDSTVGVGHDKTTKTNDMLIRSKRKIEEDARVKAFEIVVNKCIRNDGRKSQIDEHSGGGADAAQESARQCINLKGPIFNAGKKVVAPAAQAAFLDS